MLALPLAALLAWPAAAAKAPDFSLPKLLGAPVSRIDGLKDLKGKVVFLEFWATWCAPCVAEIPRMNRLVEKLAGEPVAFIAVTDEPVSMIKPFLEKRPIKAWVGIDEAGRSLKAFRVFSRPDGYLIGKDGELLARISPGELDEKDIRAALEGSFRPRSVEWERPRPRLVDTGKEQALFEFAILEASSGAKARMSWDGEWSRAEAMPFMANVAHFWGVPFSQVLIDSAPVAAFGYRLRPGRAGETRALELARPIIEATFGVRVSRETREADVFELRLSSAPAARPKPAPQGMNPMAFGGGRVLGDFDLKPLARILGDDLSVPVFDETGLKGAYSFDLEWERGRRDEAGKALAAAGLLLAPARRPVEYVRVSLAYAQR